MKPPAKRCGPPKAAVSGLDEFTDEELAQISDQLTPDVREVLTVDGSAVPRRPRRHRAGAGGQPTEGRAGHRGQIALASAVSNRGSGGGYKLFRQRQFRELWAANLLSSIGLVMLLLGSAWVMLSLTTNPLMVSMVQTATSLPFLLLALPAGIMSDLYGHRRLLLGAHTWMLLAVAGLAALTFSGYLNAWSLLVALSIIGIGLVFQQSAWKPFLHDLLPSDQLVSAISFNSLSNKLAQVVGRLTGGLLVGFKGAMLVLGTRALSHLVMIAVVRRVPRPAAGKRSDARSSREALASFSDGWRVLRASRQLYGPLIRLAVFMMPCTGMVALLPLEAKENIQTEVIGYGGLLTSLALGTVSAVSLMPWLQGRARMGTLSSTALGGFRSLCSASANGTACCSTPRSCWLPDSAGASSLWRTNGRSRRRHRPTCVV